MNSIKTDNYISIAKNILFSLMKEYLEVIDNNILLDLKIFRSNKFVNYIRFKKNFKKFYDEYKGNNQGIFASITSWKYSKLKNKDDKYLYIVTLEGYGSSSWYDDFLNDEDNLKELKFYIKKCNSNIKINQYIKKFKDIIKKSIEYSFNNIRLFMTYEEASSFIMNIGNFNIPSKKQILRIKNIFNHDDPYGIISFLEL